ncbi:CDF family Co(II)/Ni(II) efflux transporter DmeF [Maricaulis sp.]|uniref:CDF family Co(II)/Ni(II) efflux transporter DmeF n=1 Tax=Maricaulis sp. TaxID=1486257 RepID=UPI003A93A588
MHDESVKALRHDHVFLGDNHDRNARRTWIVIGLTAMMMVGEIIAGTIYGSMALLADGFHMATHAGALAIAALAYYFARRHAHNPSFTFGTGKLGELAGFSSAIILAIVALLIGFESVMRLAVPIDIRFDEAIAVAVLGLVVNLVSAWLLHQGDHDHDHQQGHGHDHHRAAAHEAHHDHPHDKHHEDHNLRAAYLHVLTDALTSVLAIAGLLAGRFYGWVWMDPLMGIVGAIVIMRWSIGLMRGAGAILLDVTPDGAMETRIREILEREGDAVSDLHLWRVGPGHMALVVSLVSQSPRPVEHYKQSLAVIARLSHVTIEVHGHEVAA